LPPGTFTGLKIPKNATLEAYGHASLLLSLMYPVASFATCKPSSYLAKLRRKASLKIYVRALYVFLVHMDISVRQKEPKSLPQKYAGMLLWPGLCSCALDPAGELRAIPRPPGWIMGSLSGRQ